MPHAPVNELNNDTWWSFPFRLHNLCIKGTIAIREVKWKKMADKGIRL